MHLAEIFPATPPLLLLPAAGLLSGLAKAVADAQAHGSPRLVRWWPRWAGPEAWRNKYRGGDPAAGPAFPGSTTVLVSLTDTWHLAGLVGGLAADVALLAVAWPTAARWGAVGYVVARRGVFQPVYSWLRK